MTFNGIDKIKDDAGDYIVLTDYGQDGISVSHQAESLVEAAEWMIGSGACAPQSIVKLVRVQTVEK